jgi:diphthamide synthase (EF-2-diphthine--ammonia ligase)
MNDAITISLTKSEKDILAYALVCVIYSQRKQLTIMKDSDDKDVDKAENEMESLIAVLRKLGEIDSEYLSIGDVDESVHNSLH